MHRMLIVDDEPIIANSIYQYFREEPSLELELFRAYSAMEALEISDKTRLDIVITDISMPVMNGIELQEKLYRKWPNCKFIYLTSHDNVQYAQKAIRNGAFVDYVLKNEEDSHVLEAVRKAVLDIEKASRNEQLLSQARRQMQTALPFLQQEYLGGLLGGRTESAPAMEERFRQFDIPLNSRLPVLMFYGRIDDYGSKFSVADRRLLHFSLENIVQEHIGHSARVISVSCDVYTVAWFLQPPASEGDEYPEEKQWEYTMRYAYEMLELVQGACKRLLGVALSLVMTASPVGWEQLNNRYSRLQYVMNRYFGISQELLMVDREEDGESGTANEDSGNRLRTKVKQAGLLERLLESGQREEFFALFEEIADVPDHFPYSYQVELLSAIQACLLSCLNRSPQMLERVKPEDYFMAAGNIAWMENIRRFRKLADVIFDWSAEDQRNKVSSLMNAVRAYVEDHLQDDLSLTRVAERVYHNPTYFSKLFKRTMGIGYNEFVTERRLDKAVQLLTTTNMKVNEVSVQVGYETPTYFMRVFKKRHSMTPQEYRESKLLHLL